MQLTFSYTDQVAAVFQDEQVTNLCKLIDQKQSKGLKCNDLKQWLLGLLASKQDLSGLTRQCYLDAYEFVEKDLTV